MFCEQCGNKLNTEAKFCAKCGKQVLAAAEQAMQAVLACTHCNTQLEDKDKFCPKCGKPNVSIPNNALSERQQGANEYNEMTQISEPHTYQAEKFLFTKENIKIELNQWPNHEAKGILTITNKRIHFTASTITARIGLLGINEDYKQAVSNLSIPFSEIVNISKKRSILDFGAYNFCTLLKDSPVINSQIPTGILLPEKELSIIIFKSKGSEDLQKVLEQQLNQAIIKK